MVGQIVDRRSWIVGEKIPRSCDLRSTIHDLSFAKPLFVLDEPHYHRLRIGQSHRFRGLALGVDGRSVTAISIRRGGTELLEAPVDEPFPEIAPLIGAESAARCRFDFEFQVDGKDAYDLIGRMSDGSEDHLFVYDLPFALGDADRLHLLFDGVRRVPAPPVEIIAVTQGLGEPESYRDSSVSAFISIETMADISAVRDVLDIGCGTGRLLVGWHAADPSRRLTGVDINADLIRWNQENLSDVASWSVSTVEPPLHFADASFDFVQLTSVFTHLPIRTQRAWVNEIRRLLRPRGHALITLHGELYASILLDAQHRDLFQREGYVEIPAGAEGANSFSTFHSEGFARELFRAFSSLRVYPRGVIPGRFATIAASQDVYILGR